MCIRDRDKLDSYDMIQALWREYRQAHSMYDENGVLKSNEPVVDPATGRTSPSPLSVAKELRQYRKDGQKFLKMFIHVMIWVVLKMNLLLYLIWI